MNDFEAPAPSKGMPSWSDGVTLSYGEDGVRLTRHRWRFQHRRKDNVKDTLLWRGGIPRFLLTSQGVCSEDAMEGWFRVDGMCVGRLVYSGGSV